MAHPAPDTTEPNTHLIPGEKFSGPHTLITVHPPQENIPVNNLQTAVASSIAEDPSSSNISSHTMSQATVELNEQHTRVLPTLHKPHEMPQDPGNHKDSTSFSSLKAMEDQFWERFERYHQLDDLNTTIQYQTQLLLLLSNDNPERPGSLNRIGASYLVRYQRTGVLSDIKNAASYMEQAVALTPDGNYGRPGRLSNLGNAYQLLSKRFGGLEYMNKALSCQEQAVALSLDGDPYKPGFLNNLGSICKLLSGRLGRQDLLDKAIVCFNSAISLTPTDDLDRSGYLNNLASAYELLFRRFGKLDDLNKAASHQEQAVMLTPQGHPHRAARIDGLGEIHQALFDRFGTIDNIDKAVNYFCQAVALTHDGHPDRPVRLNNLGGAYQSRFKHLGRISDLNQAIAYREQAALLIHDGHSNKAGCLNNLGSAYQLLFEQFGKLDSMDKMTDCFHQAVKLTPDDHPSRPAHLSNLGSAYKLMFEQFRQPDHLSQTVLYLSQAVELTSDDHPNKPGYLNNLGNTYQSLFELFGRIDDANKGIDFRKQAVVLTPDDHPNKPARLNNLGVMYKWLSQHLDSHGNADEAVKYLHQAVALTPDNHPGKPRLVDNLGSAYQLLFEQLGSLDYIERAISYKEQSVSLTPDGHPSKSALLGGLGGAYGLLFSRSHLSDHCSKALNAFKDAALMPVGRPSIRLRASHFWAKFSLHSKKSPLEAYMQCMQLLPQVVWLGSSVSDRYYSISTEVRSMVTEATAAAISIQRYDLAVEWLEQGRCLVWSQLLELRTPFDQLHETHPEIAEELRQTSYLLESASMSQSKEEILDYGAQSLFKAAQVHRQLAEHREELIDSIRNIPGFDDFLRPPKLSELTGHIQDGIVVLLNVHASRCDALILQAGSKDVAHIPLLNFTYEKAEEACNQLAEYLNSHSTRSPIWLPEKEPQLTFQDILSMLWYDIVKPVLVHLGITSVLPIQDLPHITWCITGPLSFLPLHAAGDYSGPKNSILPNLVVSSYTPNLSSLGRTPPTLDSFSGMLAISQGSSVRGLNSLPATADELAQLKRSFKGLQYTQLSEQDACADLVLEAMTKHNWVHFACHASQNRDYPLRSALHLHDEDLDLAAISKNQMNNAQLAFLSACQTATGDTKLPDEAIHLAAGLLMAGYWTVIATMWSIYDADAPLVAEKVYEYMLEGGVPDSRKAAKALHKATTHLRETVGIEKFTRWVPFVHIGC